MNIQINPAALIKTTAFLMAGFAAAWSGQHNTDKRVIASGQHVVNEQEIPACRAATVGAPDYMYQKQKCRAEMARLAGKLAPSNGIDWMETPKWREQCLDAVENEAAEIRTLGRAPETEWIEQKRKHCAGFPTRAELDTDLAKYEAEQRQYLQNMKGTPLSPKNNQREYCLNVLAPAEFNTERNGVLTRLCNELPTTPAPNSAMPTRSPREQCFLDIEEDKRHQEFTDIGLKERQDRCQTLAGPASPEPVAAAPKPEITIRKPGTSGFRKYTTKDIF